VQLVSNRSQVNVLTSPGIPLSVDGGRGGGGLELADIEAGGVAGRHCDRRKRKNGERAKVRAIESRQKGEGREAGAVRLAE
jgi:hypothetical protein